MAEPLLALLSATAHGNEHPQAKLDQLDTWVRRAATAESIDEVFTDEAEA